MRLDELHSGETAIIVKILGHGAFRKRMIEMGFVKGHEIKVLLHAPLRDPIKYSLMGYEVSLRRSEAHLVEVLPVEVESHNAEESASGQEKQQNTENEYSVRRKTINVALVGNPNCGKTSLFNIASGAREHVGNYSGVTVDAKEGKFNYKDYTFNIVDLPGTYSLASYSPEERYVRKYLRDETPDVIINVVVASNLERNLYLTTELIDMDRSMVIALNMYDELKKRGDALDYKLLGEMIGVPVVPTVSKTGAGINKLFDTVINVYEGKEDAVRHIHVPLGSDVEKSVSVIKDEIKKDDHIGRHFSPRYLAIKLIEQDKDVEDEVRKLPAGDSIIKMRDSELQRIEKVCADDVSSLIAGEKYGFIAGALAETLTKGEKETNESTRIIDYRPVRKRIGNCSTAVRNAYLTVIM